MIDKKFSFETGFVTDTGLVRDHNEDNYFTNEAIGVWVVADGMGGHAAGDYASNAIVHSVSGITRPHSAPVGSASVRISAANGGRCPS